MLARLPLPLLLLTVLVWTVTGVSAVGWTLRWLEPTPQALPVPVPAALEVQPAVIAAWLGASTAAPEQAAAAPSRYTLLGVIAQGRGGVALLSVDGQPGKPYLVGSLIHEGLMLKSVGPRHAELAASAGGPVLARLDLPEPPELAAPVGMELVSKPTAAPR
jgi:general secretion pathway protein C